MKMMELKLTTQFKKDLKRCKHNEDLLKALEAVLDHLAESELIKFRK